MDHSPDFIEKDGKDIELIYHCARVGIGRLNPAGRLIRSNPMVAQILGYAPEELRSLALHELLVSCDPHVLQNLSDTPVELQALHKGGHIIDLSLKGTRLQGSEDTIIVIEEITDRKRSEGLLRRQKHVLELMAKSLPLNEVLGAIVKMIEEQSPGTLSTIYLIKDGKLTLGAAPSWPESFVKAVDGCPVGPHSGSCGAAAHSKRRIVSPDITNESDDCWGEYRSWILSYGIRAAWSTPVLAPSGEVLGTVSMCLREARMPSQRDYELVDVASKLMSLAIERDQTERLIIDQKAQILAASKTRQLETQLEFSERLASLGRLAAGIAHEINNPLAHICGSIELAKIKADHKAEALRLIDGASQSALRIAKIVESLKSFSRNDSAQVAPTDVSTAIESAVLMAQSRLKHTARLERRYGNTKLLLANEGRLTQVFLNLLVNAAQAYRSFDMEKNKITITTDTNEQGETLIEFRDNGCGMPAEIKARIFEPFFTTKPVGEGTGLGLSISYAIIKALGGGIDVESEPEEGTAVRVRLPKSLVVETSDERSEDPQSELGLTQEPCRQVQPAGLRILIIDDEPNLTSLLSAYFGPKDQILTFTDPKAALEVALRREFDVILCDLTMPDLSGIDFYNHVQEQKPGQEDRIIFISGGVIKTGMQKAVERLPNKLILKPFTMDEIRQACYSTAGRIMN